MKIPTTHSTDKNVKITMAEIFTVFDVNFTLKGGYFITQSNLFQIWEAKLLKNAPHTVFLLAFDVLLLYQDTIIS